jgi:magnesium transporter
MTPFKLTEEFVIEIEQLIEQNNDAKLNSMLGAVHYADVAEIINELDKEKATYLIKLLDSDKTSDVLTELDEDVREAILSSLSTKEIASELEELDTDDAADIIGELPKDQIQDVISKIEDREHAKDIVADTTISNSKSTIPNKPK